MGRVCHWGFWAFAFGAAILLSACDGIPDVREDSGGGSSSTVRAAQLLTPDQGWALAVDGLWVTDDAGLTWSNITPPGVSARAIQNAVLLNRNTGWLVTLSEVDPRSGVVTLTTFRTVDGGTTWTLSVLPSLQGQYGASVFLDFVDGLHGWVSVRNQTGIQFSQGELFATDDGGITWVRRSIPIGAAVRFVDENVGWTAGGPAGDQLYVSHDGGSSWERQGLAPSREFKASSPTFSIPFFASPTHGVLPVTFSGKPTGVALYVTRDGGETWTSVATVMTPASIVGVGVQMPLDVVDIRNAFVATPGSDKIYTTRDGRTFEAISPNGLPLGTLEIDFASPQVGWARAQGGTLSRTSDAGQTWDRLSP